MDKIRVSQNWAETIITSYIHEINVSVRLQLKVLCYLIQSSIISTYKLRAINLPHIYKCKLQQLCHFQIRIFYLYYQVWWKIILCQKLGKKMFQSSLPALRYFDQHPWFLNLRSKPFLPSVFEESVPCNISNMGCVY